jgi:DNA invertase Pin-like site-specific DNA recombinase
MQINNSKKVNRDQLAELLNDDEDKTKVLFLELLQRFPRNKDDTYDLGNVIENLVNTVHSLQERVISERQRYVQLERQTSWMQRQKQARGSFRL